MEPERIPDTDDEMIDKHLIRSGIIFILAMGTVLTWCGIDQLEKFSLVRRTREKAELLAKKPCSVDYYSPSEKWKVPGRTHVEYQCEDVAIGCGLNPSNRQYECVKK